MGVPPHLHGTRLNMGNKELRARKLLEQGLQKHRAGDLKSADLSYARAADLDPRNADAPNLRGVIALMTGNAPLAVTLFRRATQLRPGDPGIWGNLGNALFETANLAESKNAYQRAAQLAPGNPDFVIGKANALAAAGCTEDAYPLFESVAQQHPRHAEAWFGLARLTEQGGDRQQAIELYQRVLQINPMHGNAHLNLGATLQSLNRMGDAEQCYRRALDSGAARETVFINLVSVLTAQGKFAEAAACATTAIAEFSDSMDLHRTLAGAYLQMGDMRKALAPMQRAVQLAPDNLTLKQTVSGILFEMGFPEEGLAAIAQALQANPGDTSLAHRYGIAQLTAGHFDEGWRHFIHREVRRTKLETRPWLKIQLPVDIAGKPVRVYREQGLGDELFFLRYAPVLRSLGADVTAIADPRLEPMLSRGGHVGRVIAELADRREELPPDAADPTTHILVGDLPHALYRDFGAHCHTLPVPLALLPLPEKVDALRRQLLSLGTPPYLALTWRGGVPPNEQKSKWWALYKEIRLDCFGKMLAGLPFTLLAVQRKPAAGELEQLSAAAGAPIHDLSDLNDDLEEMLALMAVVDEYAGVSNTNMHLRAGLRRSARVLVPRPSEWRWLAYGDRSPWFPDFTVYRQGTDGTWDEALAQLRTHLIAR